MSHAIGIVAPYGRDAQVMASILTGAGLQATTCAAVPEAMRLVEDGVLGAVAVAEEAFNPGDLQVASSWIERQPPWSDLPIVLLTKRGGNAPHQFSLAASLGNVTLIERPFAPLTLVSAARAALRARARQRQTETYVQQLASRERELTEERVRLEASEARLTEAHEKLGRRFAEALAEKRVLADIVERTDAFVQVSDLNYRWLAINRASADEFERIFGVRPQVGQSMLDVLDGMPEHRKSVQAVWGRALAGEEFTEVAEFGDPGRDRRSYEMKFNSLRNEQGERIGAYQFVYDVTERLRAQEKLAEAQERMHEMAKLETLGQLTGGVAHDFNNLLTPIMGALDQLHRNEDDPRALRLITGALEAAERAVVLIQRLLSFARRQHLEARDIDVGDLIQGMRDLIQRSIGAQVDVRVRADEDLPAAHIDPNQLELAVLNLAVNASDAMPGGGALSIDVSLRVLADGDVAGLRSGSYIRLAVSDTGMGMDEATLNRSIEPFFTTKGAGRGTGLGLSMVHGLAAQSGGTLTLHSEVGKGTTAEIWLPVSGGVADRLAPSGLDSPTASHPRVVLVVDDEELVRRATAHMLRDMGHDVIEAASAVAALEVLGNRPDIELIVSDYLMPGVRGGQLIRNALALRPELKALMITGYAKLAAGEANFPRLAKPFRAADLSREIEKLFDGDGAVPLSSYRKRPR